MHYQAVAWSLVEDQAKERDGYARAYPPSDVLQLVRQWWPAGFEGTETAQLRGWLDEMCGLGVLVRNNSGHYRLRSPNMVGLLGKETEIEDRLLELTTSVPTLPMEADSHHAPLDDRAAQYSPLTYSDERSLLQPRFGVGLVFASGALGSTLLRSAVRRFLPADLPDNVGDCTEMPSSVLGGRLEHWLQSYLKNHPKTERMIVYQHMSYAASQEMAQTISIAQKLCHRHQSKDRWLRVIFLLNDQATWRWLGMPVRERIQLEEASDAALWCRPWTLSAVRRRLAHHEKLDDNTASFSAAALAATGGWPFLLDELFRQCGKETDIRPTVRALEAELKTPDSSLVTKFHAQLGLSTLFGEQARRLLDFIRKEGGTGQLEIGYLLPDLIGGAPLLTPEQCDRALEYLQRLNLVRIRYDSAMIDPIVAQVMAMA
jgi:hypothetical protein